WDRTFVSQFDRHSPFSLWDWGQYHARGIPDLAWLRKVLTGVVVIASAAFAFVPRGESPLQLAALTGGLLMGFAVVWILWVYLYIRWSMPFVACAVLAPTALTRSEVPAWLPRAGADRRTVLAGVGAVALLLVSWTLLHFSAWNRILITDVPVYEGYGRAM